MAEKYYSILTNRGKELEAQSSATGKPVIIKDFVVGDGNGQSVIPDPALTTLVHEVYRSGISALQVSPDQANQFFAQIVLPADVGGFVVREVGLLTDAGELYAVANCAAIEKPVSGISVKLQFRLAVSETADIELKVATGDGLFLRQDANLGDVQDVVESRKNIGLKGAAVLDVGTVKNTVAAGDDVRIVNALQKENNLSDVVDTELARSNLQLGTAAIKNVQVNKDDTTAGRVLVNGGALALRSVAASGGGGAYTDDCNNLPANSVSFVYGSAKNSPGFEASVLDFAGLGGAYRTQIAASYSDGGKRLKYRAMNGDNSTWGAWTSVLTNYGGTVSYLDGATYYKTNPAGWYGGGAFADQYRNNAAPFLVPYGFASVKNNSQYLPIVKGISHTEGWGYGAAVSFGILRSGNADFGSAIIQIIGDSGDGAIFGFNANGTFNAPNAIIAGGGIYDTPGVRAYSSNNPPPQQDLSAYATYAWVNGNFISSARRGGQVYQAGSGSGQGMAYEAPAGCFLTGINTIVNDGRGMGVYYRALQVYIPSRGYVQIGD